MAAQTTVLASRARRVKKELKKVQTQLANAKKVEEDAKQTEQ